MIIAEIILAIVQALPVLIPLLEKIFGNLHGLHPVMRALHEAELHTVLANWQAGRAGGLTAEAKSTADQQLTDRLQGYAHRVGIAA